MRGREPTARQRRLARSSSSVEAEQRSRLEDAQAELHLRSLSEPNLSGIGPSRSPLVQLSRVELRLGIRAAPLRESRPSAIAWAKKQSCDGTKRRAAHCAAQGLANSSFTDPHRAQQRHFDCFHSPSAFRISIIDRPFWVYLHPLAATSTPSSSRPSRCKRIAVDPVPFLAGLRARR